VKPDEVGAIIQYRLKQAQIALEDAKFLFDGQRSAQSIINRSYYAMFYAALALLQHIDKVPSKHTGVMSLFDTEFVLKGIFSRELSRDFHRTFELRQTFDYKVTVNIEQTRAYETWQKAVRFVEAVKNYLSGSSSA
jgi:uncharacterized protein (UPF0332 family)